MDAILSLLPQSRIQQRLLIASDARSSVVKALRDKGWVTVMALDPDNDLAEEALRLGCSHYLAGKDPQPVQKEQNK